MASSWNSDGSVIEGLENYTVFEATDVRDSDKVYNRIQKIERALTITLRYHICYSRPKSISVPIV